MSLTRKLIDLARSNLNSLLEKAADSTDPRRKLASIPDVELEAELERRKTARRVEQNIDDAKARVGAGEEKAKPAPDRAERERMAKEREARVKAERAARAARDASASSASSSASSSSGGASRSSSAPPPRSSSSSSSSSGSRAGSNAGTNSRRPPPSSRPRDPQIVAYYERLEVPVGSDFETVKAAYRRLMRKYHPDLHGHKSPEKLKAATEVAQALTQAYNELEKVLLRGGR